MRNEKNMMEYFKSAEKRFPHKRKSVNVWFYSHVQVLMNKLWFDQSLYDAVDEPRVHCQLVPDQNVTIEMEEKYRLNEKIVKGLKDIGHKVLVGRKSDFAVVQAVYRKAKGEIDAKSDPRKFGVPAGE